MTRRAGWPALSALLIATACAPPEAGGRAPPSAATASATDLDMLEALFRHQFANNASGAQRTTGTFCVGVGPSRNALADPPPALVARLADERPTVKTYSACGSDDLRSYDKATRANAIIFNVHSIGCTSATRCEAQGGYSEANLSAAASRYVAEKLRGRWRVTGDVLEAIA